MYRKGDRGQPCLIPLLDLKKSEGPPFTRGAIQGELMQACICLKKMGGGTKLFQNYKCKIMSQSIKGVGQIKFDGHSGFPIFHTRMDCFFDQQYVITYVTVGYEASLIWRD